MNYGYNMGRVGLYMRDIPNYTQTEGLNLQIAITSCTVPHRAIVCHVTFHHQPQSSKHLPFSLKGATVLVKTTIGSGSLK